MFTLPSCRQGMLSLDCCWYCSVPYYYTVSTVRSSPVASTHPRFHDNALKFNGLIQSLVCCWCRVDVLHTCTHFLNAVLRQPMYTTSSTSRRSARGVKIINQIGYHHHNRQCPLLFNSKQDCVSIYCICQFHNCCVAVLSLSTAL